MVGGGREIATPNYDIYTAFSFHITHIQSEIEVPIYKGLLQRGKDNKRERKKNGLPMSPHFHIHTQYKK